MVLQSPATVSAEAVAGERSPTGWGGPISQRVLLGGSWVVISGIISPPIRVISL